MMTFDLAKTDVCTVSGFRGPVQAAEIEISVFGPLSIKRDGIVLTAKDLGGPKPRQVLEILLMSFGTAVSKARIVELLWGGNHPAVALPTLESYVSVLRRHLQPGGGRTGPLRTVSGGYAMDRSMVDLDLDRFETLTKMAAQQVDPRAALALLTEALEVASAPLLGDELLPAWAEEERGLHAARVCLTRVQAAEVSLSLGEMVKAVSFSADALKDDPLNERAWTAMVLGLEGNGENTEALRAFDRCRRIMDDELGCAPGPALREAQARLLTKTAAASHPADLPRPISESNEIRFTAAPEEQPDKGRLGVLIVDDHTTFSDLLAGALDREPDFHSVGAAKSAACAVDMVRDLRPDIVIMDLHLPDASGLEAAERILSIAPKTRVVMLTGNPTQEAIQAAAQIGMCAFLPKDGELGAMLDTLRHVHPGNMILNPSLLARWGTLRSAAAASVPA